MDDELTIERKCAEELLTKEIAKEVIIDLGDHIDGHLMISDMSLVVNTIAEHVFSVYLWSYCVTNKIKLINFQTLKTELLNIAREHALEYFNGA